MCDNLHLNSMKQCETPLNTLFFSRFNVNILQRGIRQDFKNKTGIAIDYQNEDDLYAIMRVVFINNAGDHEYRVNEQVKKITQSIFLVLPRHRVHLCHRSAVLGRYIVLRVQRNLQAYRGETRTHQSWLQLRH